MVLEWDGKSSKVAHVWTEIGNLPVKYICLGDFLFQYGLKISSFLSNYISYPYIYTLISSHDASLDALPSNKSTMS